MLLDRPVPTLMVGLLSLAVGLGFAPGAAHADDDDPYDRSGFYLGLSGIYQRNVLENELEDLVDDAADPFEGKLSIEDTGGLSALVGYRVFSWFALELQWEWVDEYDVDGTVVPIPLDTVYSMSGHTLMANTKWIIPFWRIQPYLVVGAGVAVWDLDRGPNAGIIEALDSDIDISGGTNTDFAGRLGLGVDFYVTEDIVLNVQGGAVVTIFDEPELEDIDALNYIGFSAGLQYRF